MMLEKKDFVSVRLDGKRSISIAINEFIQSFQNILKAKCSFSKFASLRPKHCVLAGASGTHSVCVCAIHDWLLLHAFLVRKQNEFMTKKKEELTTDECIVICDFSENYADYTDFANLTHHLKDFDLDAE